MPKNKATYHLEIPSQTDNLEVIREFISNLSRRAGFTNDDVDKIELAVDEACSNVIKHAYKGESQEPIDIEVAIAGNRFTVSVTDHGKGFDLKKIKTPDMKEYLAQMRVGGLGIHLIKSLMDEVDFSIEPGKRNQVKLVKYIGKSQLNAKQTA